MTIPTRAIEGITLASFAFEETAHIVSVLSKEEGRIKCVHKSSRKSLTRGLGPLLGVEMQVCPSEKELWKCRECIVVTSYPKLRMQLQHLKYAAQITDFLDKVLPLHLRVPHLYELYSQFLFHLPEFVKPHVGAVAFLEKFYHLEGMQASMPLFGDAPFSTLYQQECDLGHYHKLLQAFHR